MEKTRTLRRSVRLPVLRCRDCSFEWFDDTAERLRHEAICRHLGVLSPSEIRAIREQRGWSQAKFAELTGLGKASLSRWESGQLIQNAGYDKLLRLLRYSDNLDRLEEWAREPEGQDCPANEKTIQRTQPVFRALKHVDRIREEKQHFSLYG